MAFFALPNSAFLAIFHLTLLGFLWGSQEEA
jgi:hypothetical protein